MTMDYYYYYYYKPRIVGFMSSMIGKLKSKFSELLLEGDQNSHWHSCPPLLLYWGLDKPSYGRWLLIAVHLKCVHLDLASCVSTGLSSCIPGHSSKCICLSSVFLRAREQTFLQLCINPITKHLQTCNNSLGAKSLRNGFIAECNRLSCYQESCYTPANIRAKNITLLVFTPGRNAQHTLQRLRDRHASLMAWAPLNILNF